MRLILMVLALTLACAVVIAADDSTAPCTTPCPTIQPVPVPPVAGSQTCPTPRLNPCQTTTCQPCPTTAQAQSFDCCLIQQFGVTQQQIDDLRKQGYSDKDIALASALSKKAGVPLSDVLTCFCEVQDWNGTANKWNLCLADIEAMANVCLCPQPVGAGPCVCSVIYGPTGNVLLTADEAYRYYRMGYDWMDVALAVNIASQTGYPVGTTLMDIRRGVTYEEIAIMQAVPFNVAFNFTCYPFVRQSIYSANVEQKNIDKFAKYQVPGTCPGLAPMPRVALPSMRPSY
jgi:hypothetical protein